MKTKDYDAPSKTDDKADDKGADAPSAHTLVATGGGRAIWVRLSAIDAATDAGDAPNKSIRLLLRSGEGLTIDATDDVWTAIRGAIEA